MRERWAVVGMREDDATCRVRGRDKIRKRRWVCLMLSIVFDRMVFIYPVDSCFYDIG